MNVKQIRKEQNRFDEVYKSLLNTPYGSLIQSIGILKPEYRKEKYAFVRAFEKARLPYIDDDKLIKKTIEALGYSYSEIAFLPIVKVESKYNTLFYPYLLDENEDILVLPLLSNGLYQSTAYHYDKITPIDWEREFANE